MLIAFAAGGWFEFYELFMPGFISLGLIKSGVFTESNRGLFDLHSFASFLASFFLGMFGILLSRPFKSSNGRLEIQAVPPFSEISQSDGSTPKKRIQF